MEYTIQVKNKFQDNTDSGRSYCVVAQPPVVVDENNYPIQLGGLMTPVFSVTETASYDSLTSVAFRYEYFAFVGVHNKATHPPKIEYRKGKPVKLGSGKDDGSVTLADFDVNRIDIKIPREEELKDDNPPYAPRGAIRIKCGKAIPANVTTRYVIGLAQRLVIEKATEAEDDREFPDLELPDPVPIAAIAYKPGKWYTITPSSRICIMVAGPNTSEGQVFDHKSTKVVPVDFKHTDKGRVTLIENDKGEFRYQKGPATPIAEATLQQLFSGESPQPPPRVVPTQQPASAQARAPKWKEEANRLGFTENRQLAGFHNDQRLRDISMNASNWGSKISANEDFKDEYLDDLLVLGLFDTILFLDNSTSIDWEPERSTQLQDIAGSIVDVENIYENTASVRIEFLNGKPRDDTASTAEEVRELIANITNHGRTPLGTQLRRKILDRFVYPKLDTKGTFRPVLVCVITDGDPQGEENNDNDMFKKEIRKCKDRLRDRDKTKVGEKHVLFQISRVGNDRGAIKFLSDLRADTELKGILHITSYQGMDIQYEADDPIFTYAAAISRLAGAAFNGLKRNEDGEFVFPES
ncbi:hypothetical protein EG329_000988 [Mollisiaceae sp. DMI_Dod_QoI]|nr:hypothetical protein EG329_000988 [Helotiales sp. DMI_Dod_QoI]